MKLTYADVLTTLPVDATLQDYLTAARCHCRPHWTGRMLSLPHGPSSLPLNPARTLRSATM